jgi:hypothetical protein
MVRLPEASVSERRLRRALFQSGTWVHLYLPRLRAERGWPPVTISSNFRRDQRSCAHGIPLADPSRLSGVPQMFRTPAIFELQANTKRTFT